MYQEFIGTHCQYILLSLVSFIAVYYILLSLFSFFHSCISLDYLSNIFIIVLYVLDVILPLIGLGLRDLIIFTILDPRIKRFDHSWCIYIVILLVKELGKTFQKFSFIIVTSYFSHHCLPNTIKFVSEKHFTCRTFYE